MATAAVLAAFALACQERDGARVIPVEPGPCVADQEGVPKVCAVMPARVFNDGATTLWFDAVNVHAITGMTLDDPARTRLGVTWGAAWEDMIWAELPKDALPGLYAFVLETAAGPVTTAKLLTVEAVAPSPCGCPSVSIAEVKNASGASVPYFSGDLEVRYQLAGAGGTVNLTPEYSTNGGSSWLRAAERTGGKSEGTTNLVVAPGGAVHSFVWDSAQNEPNQQFPSWDFRFTLDCCTGTPVRGGIHKDVPLRNDFPMIALTKPLGVNWGDVLLSFTFTDPYAGAYALVGEYSPDNRATWNTAVRSAVGRGVDFAAVTAAPDPGASHYFFWDSVATEPALSTPAVWFRLYVQGRAPASGAEAGPFLVDNSKLVSAAVGATYGPPTLYDISAVDPGGINTIELAAGDFDGDGKADLAVTDQTTSAVYVVTSDGANFTNPRRYDVGYYLPARYNGPVNVQAGRFNGDGAFDLVTWTSVSVDMTPLINDGAGGFTVGTPLLGVPAADFAQGGYWGTKMDTGDVDGDGVLDVVTVTHHSSATASALGVFLGNGDGTFVPRSQATGVDQLVGVALADFDGDGRTDAALTNYNYPTPGANPPRAATVAVLKGRGDGTFDTAPAFSHSIPASRACYPFKPVAADFDGDGTVDLAVGMNPFALGSGGDLVLMMRNLGGMNFTTEYLDLSPIGRGPSSILAGDFNSDGKPDAAITLYGSNAVALLMNNAAGSGPFLSPGYNVTTAERYPVGGHMGYIAQGDFDGDGKLDLAFAQVADAGQGLVSWIRQR